MGVMPVTKLLLNMSCPIMISMLVMACYNIVDSIFVSKINENALTAASLAFPVQTLMIAVASGTAVGVNALLAMQLGRKNQDAVNKIAVNGLFLAVCSSIVFAILSLFLIDPYLKTQTDNQEIIMFGNIYTNIVTRASLGTFITMMAERLLQATGRTVYTMIAQITGAVTNIILDPLMIFGIGPFPEMGVAGAAWATVIGQVLGAIVNLYFNIKKNPDIHFRFVGFKPELPIIAQIYKIGIPSILLQSINSITTYGMNLILGAFSSTAIAVYGVYFKLNSFVFMPVFGLTAGMVPIISFNYGARKPERIQKTVRSTIYISLLIMLVGIAVFEFIPEKFLGLFDASDYMLEIGCTALRIIAPSFIGAAIAITFLSLFQAVGSAFLSMTVSFVRQLIVLLPVAFLFAKTGNLNNVWWSFSIAEAVAVILAYFFFRRIKKTKLDKLI